MGAHDGNCFTTIEIELFFEEIQSVVPITVRVCM